MKFTGTLSVPDLGFTVAVVVELEAEAQPKADTLDDLQLRARWRCSARTTKRLRDQRRLPYLQPSPRKFQYRVADVLAYEASTGRGVHRRATR